MNQIMNINNLKLVEVEKPTDDFSFFKLKNKILNKEDLTNYELNKIWCIIGVFIVLSFLIYELYNLQYLK